MKRQLTLSFAVLLLLSSACSMAPKYEQPAMPAPEAWNQQSNDAPHESARPATEIPWREFFTDEDLRSVIDLALANNRDLWSAALTVERTREMYRIQRAELVPDVGVSATEERYRLPADMSSTGSSGTFGQYSVNLGVAEWELDFFGRIRSLKDSALELFLASEDTRTAAQVSLVSAVSAAYLSLAADSENLALAGETLTAQQETYELILRTRDLGMADDLQLRQAQSQVEAARVEQARMRGLVALDRNALELLVGAPVPKELLPERLTDVAEPKVVDPGLPSEALLVRPDIMAAEHRLKAANADIGAARATLFPRISLTAAGGTSSSELSGLFESGSGAWAFAPQISLPIFSGGALRANVRVTEIEKELAVADYEKAIQTAFREVSDALALGATLSEQRTAQGDLVEALDATHELALSRWEAGLSDYLEVLVAERSLYSARQGLISVRLADEVNRITLFKVLGGGGDVNTTEGETSGGA